MLAQLAQAYLRRRQFEDRALAVAIVSALGEALGGRRAERRVTAGEMFALLGVTPG